MSTLVVIIAVLVAGADVIDGGAVGLKYLDSHDVRNNFTAPRFKKMDKMQQYVGKPAGNMLRLRCPSDGNPTPNITWFKDGNIVERQLGSLHYGRWSLMLEHLSSQDSGNYTCIVCNSHACINFTFNVDIRERVHHKPIFTTALHNATVALNSTAIFQCHVLSDLHPHIEWLRGFVNNISDSNLVKVQSNCNIDDLDSDSDCTNPEILRIHNVTYDDAGWYTCIAGNSLGIIYASAYLEVVASTCCSSGASGN